MPHRNDTPNRLAPRGPSGADRRPMLIALGALTVVLLGTAVMARPSHHDVVAASVEDDTTSTSVAEPMTSDDTVGASETTVDPHTTMSLPAPLESATVSTGPARVKAAAVTPAPTTRKPTTTTKKATTTTKKAVTTTKASSKTVTTKAPTTTTVAPFVFPALGQPSGTQYVGDFHVTCYSGMGGTASGATTSTSTVAVDPSVIPLGTQIYVDGVGWRVAQDVGSGIIGNDLDIWMPRLLDCVEWGARMRAVFVKNGVTLP
jgi:3D (Asp-Asp-Asp) domain-containing protein